MPILAKLKGTIAHGLAHVIISAGILIHRDFEILSGAHPGSQFRHESLKT